MGIASRTQTVLLQIIIDCLIPLTPKESIQFTFVNDLHFRFVLFLNRDWQQRFLRDGWLSPTISYKWKVINKSKGMFCIQRFERHKVLDTM